MSQNLNGFFYLVIFNSLHVIAISVLCVLTWIYPRVSRL